MADEIFIFCDDPSHAPTREPIDVFVALPGGGWSERPVKKRVGRAGHVGTGMHMLDDSPAESGWATAPEGSEGKMRTRYALACERTPQCARRPVPSRQETLETVLDGWRELGLPPEMPLAGLAAMLEERARRKPNSPRGNG